MQKMHVQLQKKGASWSLVAAVMVVAASAACTGPDEGHKYT